MLILRQGKGGSRGQAPDDPVRFPLTLLGRVLSTLGPQSILGTTQEPWDTPWLGPSSQQPGNNNSLCPLPSSPSQHGARSLGSIQRLCEPKAALQPAPWPPRGLWEPRPRNEWVIQRQVAAAQRTKYSESNLLSQTEMEKPLSATGDCPSVARAALLGAPPRARRAGLG